MKKIVLIIALLCSTFTYADSISTKNLKFNKVGVRVGMYDGDIGFGLVLPMGKLNSDFGLGATLDYKSKDSVKFTSLGVRTCYRLKNVNLMKNMKTYVGGGLAVHKVSVDLPTILGVDMSASSTNIGADVFIGVGYKLNKKMCVKGEAAYRLMSDYGHLALTSALVYSF